MKKPVLIILCCIIGLIVGCGPTPPNGGPTITVVAGGEGHTLALTSTGTLYAWGLNNRGQLGDGGVTDSHVPVQITVPAGVTFTALAAGGAHSVALTSIGQVYTWGWNSSGQLGIGSTAESHTPVLVPGLSNIIAVSARHNHTVALKSDGTVWAWGKNDCGQLGNANNSNQLSPVQVRGQNNSGYLTNIQAIATGFSHTVALTNGGEIYAWGSNAFGQFGNNSTSSSSTPVKVPSFTNIETIAAGGWHTLAEKTNGDVYAWGKNNQGQLSQPVVDPYRIEIPTKISGYSINITGALALDAGLNY
jgi:alpha-tubulin suppressor-like RCC1 family protein